MPVFEYKALNRKGRSVRGLVTADGIAAARLRLTHQKIYPTVVREVHAGDKGKATGIRPGWIPRLQRVNPVEVTIALRQLATLLSSGIQLVECLNGVIEQTGHERLRKILIQVREKVVEGESLSQAMARHRAVFDPIFTSMIRAGETSGTLDVILQRLADFSERRMKLRKRIEAALSYPLFLIMISGIILVFLMSFVMPKVVGIFEGMKITLPWSTLVLIEITRFMKQYWWLVLGGVMLLILLFQGWTRSASGRRLWDRARLRIPVLGSFHHKAVIARFTRTLAILLKSGIILVDALEIARMSMGNRVLEEAIRDTARAVSEGEEFGVLLKRSERFPPLVVQLVSAGEKGGELDTMLAKAAEVYEEEVEAGIASLTSLLEPLVILFMGALVGFIVMAVLLPIFDMTSAVR